MLFFSGSLIGIVALIVNIVLHKLASDRHSLPIRVFHHIILWLAGGIIVAAILEAVIPVIILLTAYLLLLTFWSLKTLMAGFSGKLAYGSLAVLQGMLGGYLIVASQLPDEKHPFSQLSINAAQPLDLTALPTEWVSGLPLTGSSSAKSIIRESHSSRIPPARDGTSSSVEPDWRELEPLMIRDARIRHVLIELKERQSRDLSDWLSHLNEASVTGTAMNRHALTREQIEALKQDGAISTARYLTLLETWRLLDHDEHGFRRQQSEVLFHVLLELLEDPEVDETHRVELMGFMVEHFARDVRLINPLIRLYDRLDQDYPRQKRLNHEFLTLYRQRRTALLNGFQRMGRLALPSLLDYRRKTLPDVHYSQYYLDRFLAETFDTRLQRLYGIVPPLSIPDFFNRSKYRQLSKWSGPSYEQDYQRLSLIRIARDNWIPRPGESFMGLRAGEHQQIVRALNQTASETGLDDLLTHPDPAIRAHLAWSLAERKDPVSMPLVLELIQDTHPEVRRMAAVAMGNFRLLDMQAAHDPKFTALVAMLQTYRTPADAFSRAFALLALTTVADSQKALYVFDLLLNDGSQTHSIPGDSASVWRSPEELIAVTHLAEALQRTPEELYVKTQALKGLLAMNNPESLGVLLHYLEHIHETTQTSPNFLRHLIPHHTLPQAAENVEDAIFYLAERYRNQASHPEYPLKTLRAFLAQAYETHRSAEFFQYLGFLRAFDESEFMAYREQMKEHIMAMKAMDYITTTWQFWLIVWPLTLVSCLILQYGMGLNLQWSGRVPRFQVNRQANPAADIRNQQQVPSAAIVPVRMRNQP